MADPTETTSTTRATNTMPPTQSLPFTPELTISCPSDAWLAGEPVLVEFDWDTTIADETLIEATIDYGDGTTYRSATMADAEVNMFWHRYKNEGRYTVIATFEQPGRMATARCTFTARVLPQATTISPPATTTESACDPNYEGACVPIASDVDCAGGSGDGPEYVRGPVRVIGADIYRLDGDGDAVGCE